MALRKTTCSVVFALLVLLTSGTLVRAQEGITEHRLRGQRIDLDRPADQGSREISVQHGRPSVMMNATPANAEFPPPKYKTSGREFFVVFPSIIGSDDDAANPSKRSIYITSRGRTRVKIKFVHRPWQKDTVTVPGVMCVIDMPDWGSLRQTQFENVYDLGITVEAEDDITVYGYSHEGLSSDGWLVLPKEALGQRYYVASQRNSLNYGGSWMDPFQPRSSLVIMGTEDDTRISFKLSALSQSGRLMKDSIYTVILNRGEVFPIMARDTGFRQNVSYLLTDANCNLILDAAGNPITAYENTYVSPAPNADCDLTGSEVWSDKPIVVYGGHERATTPDMNEFDLNRLLRDCPLGISRDHLTEQMPPVELWGTEFMVMGSRMDLWGTRMDDGDMVRIISANDNTVVTINGVTVANLNAGKYYQFSSSAISHILTSQPALVIKYMKSMKMRAAENRGDPDMTVVPPIENLATAYTIPVVDNKLVFRELYLNILVHDSAITSLRINGNPPQTASKKIAGTPWSWYTEYGSPGEWRIECDLPCYAESYAYGYADSYTFAGGGDFKYQDSLSAENLDFQTLLIGRSRELTSHVKAGMDYNLLADSINIYDITWLSGDTTYFSMLDTITTPIRMGPGDKLPVRFGFHPTQVRRYEAKAWVWSSSRSLVYINVVGYGGLMTVDITPKDIDFGRVRVGTEVSQNYSVIFGGDDNLATVDLLGSTYPDLLMPPLGFNIPDVPPGKHESGTAYSSFVKFKPMTEGYRDTGFTVYAKLPQSQDVSEKLHVRLRGRGVQPNVVTQDLDFGEVRIERQSAYREIEIQNIGTDTTVIQDVVMESGDLDDFTLEAVSLPKNFTLDTTDVPGSRYRFRARFNPNDTGMKSVNVRIKTLEQTIYSKLTGRGVEPYVVAVPPAIDFGEYRSPKYPDPVVQPIDTFTIHNIGSYEAVLHRLEQTTEGVKHFSLRPITPAQTIVGDTLAKVDSIQVEVTFTVREVGDFFDTVSIFNDSRNHPLVYLKGRVTTDLVFTPDTVNFDTVRNCDPVEFEVAIHNPNSVIAILDTMMFGGDSNGFSLQSDLNPGNINIPPGETFRFKVYYEFPRELLSGAQHAKLIVYQQVGDELQRLEIELEVYRSIRTLSLLTVKPAYTPNVSDAQPFALPITIVGDHEGLTELDNFTLILRFDNDLFRPVGVSSVNSLTEGSPGFVSYQPYDPVTRTFKIDGKGLEVSKRKGDLLLTVLVQALLTVDMTAVVTPELQLDERPCAYAIDKQGIVLEYANDCGDEMLREKLRDDMGFRILSANPDPLMLSTSSAINFRYQLGYDALLFCEVLNMSGAVVAQLDPIRAQAGEGSIELPGSMLPATGMYVLRITEQPAEGSSTVKAVHTQTFRVVR